MIKRLLSCVMCVAMGLCLFGSCTGGGNATSNTVKDVDYSKRVDTATYAPDGVVAYEGKQTVSKLALNSKGEKYFEVDGKPFLYLGAQLRIDYFLQLDEFELADLDLLFKLASTLNITCIQVPIAWSDVEIAYDQYSSALVDKVMELCNKYDMKLEILWFGAYMCGYTVFDDGKTDDMRTGYVPNYVLKDSATYPLVGMTGSTDNAKRFGYNGWIGWQSSLMPNIDATIERESKAIQKLMDFVYAYDSTHGGRHTLIGVQVENEADMLASSRSKEFNLEATYNDAKHLMPESVTVENMVDYLDAETIKHISRIGEVVKAHDYGCITRTNITLASSWDLRAESLVATEGVDFVGIDPYVGNHENIKNYIRTLGRIDGNFAHIAENGGEFFNNDLMQLVAFANRGGYSVFEVVCTSNENLKDWELRGVFQDLGSGRFTNKPQTSALLEVNRLIRDAHSALANHDGMAVINSETTTGANTNVSVGAVDGFTYVCKTIERGVGFVVKHGEHVYFGSTKADEFTWTDDIYDSSKIEVGYFDSMGVWHTESTISASDKTLTLAPTRCYRMKKVN